MNKKSEVNQENGIRGQGEGGHHTHKQVTPCDLIIFRGEVGNLPPSPWYGAEEPPLAEEGIPHPAGRGVHPRRLCGHSVRYLCKYRAALALVPAKITNLRQTFDMRRKQKRQERKYIGLMSTWKSFSLNLSEGNFWKRQSYPIQVQTGSYYGIDVQTEF